MPGNVRDVERVNSAIPETFDLKQNHPNPFNPSTTIAYSIAENAHVFIAVYDALGREVMTLVDERKPAGQYRIPLDAETLSSGIYVYKIRAGRFAAARKMLLMK
jgi:hypothetical protein